MCPFVRSESDTSQSSRIDEITGHTHPEPCLKTPKISAQGSRRPGPGPLSCLFNWHMASQNSSSALHKRGDCVSELVTFIRMDQKKIKDLSRTKI